MSFVKGRNPVKLMRPIALAAIVLVASGTQLAASAQGMMEYAGLMAMPKGVPSGDTIKNMTRSYGAIPNAIPGQTSGSSSTLGITTTMPDGSVVVDQKKAAVLVTKADSEYKQAKAILSNKAAQTPTNLRLVEKLLRDAIDIRNGIWGYADPTIPQLLTILGSVYEQMKQPATALSCYQSALVYINKKFGSGSAERLDTFVHLAPLMAKQGKLGDALGFYQQITMIKERKYGASDLGTIESRISWAETAKALDKPNTADIYKQCITDIDAAGDKISQDKVAKIRGELVPTYLEILKKQGREDEAKEAETRLTAASSAAPATAATPTTTDAPASTAATPATTSATPASTSATSAATTDAAKPATAPTTTEPATPSTPPSK